MPITISILLLHLPDCPTVPLTAKLIMRLAAEMGVLINLEQIELKSLAEAQQYPFPGSPTVLINGVDLEPAARGVDYIGTA